jgi:hypothetical protein
MIGAGGSSPSDQGTGYGKDLMVKAGNSDNNNGLVGGRLFLAGGSGFNSGFNTNYGSVVLQPQGGNVGIGTTAPASKLHIETTASNPFRMVRGTTNFGFEIGGGAIGLYDYEDVTYRWYVDSIGNVGIGTTSPDRKLTVVGNGTLFGLQSGTVGGYSEMEFTANGVGGAYLFKSSAGYSSYGGAGAMNYYNTGSHAFHSNSVSNILFVTAGGKVGIETTSPNGKLTIDNGPSNIPTLTLNSLVSSQYYGNINCYDPYHGIILRGIPAAATDYTVTAQDSMSFYEYGSDFRFYKKTAAPVLQLDAQILAGEGRFRGDVVAYYSFSDERLKDDVKPLQNSLDKVLAMQGVSYKWNSGERKGQSDIGLIAQQVENVVPEVVREKTNIDGDTYKSVNYEHLVGVLIEAIKEQQNQIDELKKLIK